MKPATVPSSLPPVRLEIRASIAMIFIDNPPANALSLAVRRGVVDALHAISSKDTIRAVVIIGAGDTFIAGADINEFAKPIEAPDLPAVIAAIEQCPKPVIAAIRGVALGGGLEVALGCDARIATEDATVGLPEVTLGIIPGAGGTQRLPRLVGVSKAIELIATGRRIGAREAASLGIIDAIVTALLREAAIAYASTLPGKRPISLMPVPSSPAAEIAATIAAQAKRARGRAARAAIETVALAGMVSFEDGLHQERKVFQELRAGEEAAALRHLFFAERAARKVKRADGAAAFPVASVGIVGGGTMGAGIAAAFAASGYAVRLYDASREALDRAKATVATAIGDLRRSGNTDAEEALQRVTFAEGIEELANDDLLLEAVFEDMGVKREIMGQLSAIATPQALFATNTSYLDLDQIAAAGGRAARTLGLHFFAPAHRMKLLEVVRSAATSDATLLTGMEIARRLGKVAVIAGAGEGFIGNRIFAKYRGQAEFMLEEDALPQEIDAAAEELGFAMGPFAVNDLSGLDIAWRRRQSKAAGRDPRERYVPIADKLCELGRLGNKTGAGWYDYPNGPKGSPQPSPVVAKIVDENWPEKYRGKRLEAATIRRRLLGAIVNEAANVVEDGIARAPGDVDVVFVNGFGFSRFKGGPLFQALRKPPAKVAAMIDEVEVATGFGFRRGDVARLSPYT